MAASAGNSGSKASTVSLESWVMVPEEVDNDDSEVSYGTVELNAQC